MLTNSKFRHEDMSCLLVDDLFKCNDIKIDQHNLLLIKALISPSTHQSVYKSYTQKGRGFLFEIIANELTGVDVDKWDYFLRDAHNLGISISFQYERLLAHCRVVDDFVDDHICWKDTTAFELYAMFKTRYELYKRVYSHRTEKAVEYMICDILMHASTALNIAEMIKDPKLFLSLDDSIISRIEFMKADDQSYGLKKAQTLIKRLHERKLYKCCGYLLLSADILIPFNPKSVDDEIKKHEYPKIAYRAIEKQWTKEIYDMLEADMTDKEDVDKLEADDVKVQLMSLSFGAETQHPMSRVFFYSSRDGKVCRQVDCDQVTKMGNEFREVIVRLYVKKDAWQKECERVFERFVFEKRLVREEHYEFSSLVISAPQAKSKIIKYESPSKLTMNGKAFAFRKRETKKIVMAADCTHVCTDKVRRKSVDLSKYVNAFKRPIQ